ncbi:MAG: hypothetical protein ABI591_11065 [Kofleriaceae bacterium]
MSESAIHDLGYKRYVGARQDASRRWRVIMRHQVASSMKGFWLYKAWLGAAIMVVVIAAAFIFIATDKQWHLGRGVTERLADMALPLSFDWFGKIAFILSLRLGASIIAGDMQSGAFVFYFARSTRPVDYLFGKLAGYGILVGIIMVGGPFVVAAMRVGLGGYEDSSHLVSQLWLLLETIAAGALATVAYTAVPLCFSAMIPNRRYALGAWAAWYLIAGPIAIGIGVVMHWPVGALDIATSIKVITGAMPDIPHDPLMSMNLLGLSTTACLVSLVAQIGVAITIIIVQLNHAQRSGVGGAA